MHTTELGLLFDYYGDDPKVREIHAHYAGLALFLNDSLPDRSEKLKALLTVKASMEFALKAAEDGR